MQSPLLIALPAARPTALERALQHCVMQMQKSCVNFLELGAADSLADAQAQIDRLNGLCRLFGARRAALFCVELDGLLRALAEDASKRTTASLQLLASVSVLQLAHFISAFSLPLADEEFDATRVNILRVANGKSPLPVAENPVLVGSTALRFPVPDFLPCVLEKIGNLQGLFKTHGAAEDEDAEEEKFRHFTHLASVLEVLGMSLEMRRPPQALVHLQMHFSHLRAENPVCTPRRLQTGSPTSVDDCQMRVARELVLEQIRTRFTAQSMPHEFLHCSHVVRMLAESALHQVIADEVWQMLDCAERLCVHLRGAFQSATADNSGVHKPGTDKGQCLLLRISLLLLTCLSCIDFKADRHCTGLVRRVTRDCHLFVQQQQAALRASTIKLHAVDAALVQCVNAELTASLQVLESCAVECRSAQGIHYISETLCLATGRIASNLLCAGEVALHEIVETLRENLTLGLMRQQPFSRDQLAATELLQESLRSGLPISQETASHRDPSWQRLWQKVQVCAARMAFSGTGQEAAVRVEKGRNSGAEIAVSQVPVYLAQNIRDLLSAAENLEECAMRPAEIPALNRRLIVELRTLASGARALGVERVSRLSAVLAEVHQALAGKVPDADADVQTGNLPVAMLAKAHRRLRCNLNQAAARREVSNPREVIAELYQWLEVLPLEPDQGFAVFCREAEELMARIEQNASAMFVDHAGARTSQPRVHTFVNSLLQQLHTLKGNARLYGCEAIAMLCHRCETILLRRTENVSVAAGVGSSAGVAETMFAVAETDCRAVYLSRASTDGAEQDLQPLLVNLRAALDALTEMPRRADSLVNGSTLTTPLASTHEQTVTVPAQSLKRIAELALVARTGSRALADVLHSFRLSADPARLALLNDLLQEQERCAMQLEEEIVCSRMISFARVATRLHRLVGRHSNLLDKQVQFSVGNEDLRLDRLLLETLVAPLEHLLRNAVDHGIEPVLQRRASGKPDTGRIMLSLTVQEIAVHEVNSSHQRWLTISLRDDGAGIDTHNLLEQALRLGVEVDPAASAQERLQWLFLSGFSGRLHATQDAGHGIGLAMVRDTVTALGGGVSVRSTPGHGTEFTLLLPLMNL